MKTETKSRILFTALILGGMSPSCYLLASESYVVYGIALLLGGVALLIWVWKPWHWFSKDEA
jgi:hypothetical protein